LVIYYIPIFIEYLISQTHNANTWKKGTKFGHLKRCILFITVIFNDAGMLPAK